MIFQYSNGNSNGEKDGMIHQMTRWDTEEPWGPAQQHRAVHQLSGCRISWGPFFFLWDEEKSWDIYTTTFQSINHDFWKNILSYNGNVMDINIY
jgi:hypothetical protein